MNEENESKKIVVVEINKIIDKAKEKSLVHHIFCSELR